MIGPFPPPIHGESIAFESIYNSDELHEKFEVNRVNTSKKNITKPGKLSINKILLDLCCIIYILLWSIKKRYSTAYLSISQTKLGLIRDCVIINILKIIGKHKVITHLHGNSLGTVLDHIKNPFKNYIENSISKVDKGIALGKKLEHNYKGLVSKIEYVSNGVSSDFITKDDFLKRKYSDDKGCNLLYLSNLMNSKGYINLIKATCNLIEDGFDLNLHLVGAIQNQEEFDEIYQSLKNKKLQDRIIYHGIKKGEEKKAFFLESDIMVLPTKYKVEGQPISIIEGMAAGLPIISTNRGVIPELINECGIIINTEIEDIMRAIEYLYNNDDHRKKLGVKSREVYEGYYTEEQYLKSLIRILNDD